MSAQSNWQWCNKCQCLSFAASGSASGVGPCVAGGNHDYTDSGDYILIQNVSAGSNQQSGWLYCKKCGCLSAGGAGACKAGGTHDTSSSGNYVLTQNVSFVQSQQDNWRYCTKCSLLNYAGSASGLGPCIAGGTHDNSSSGDYVLGQVKPSFQYTTGAIVFSGGVALGGSANLTINQDGSYVFAGQFHDSGALAYNDSFAYVLLDATNQAYTFGHTGSAAGTFESGSRDDFWNNTGTNPEIANNWLLLCAAGPNATWQAQANDDLAGLLASIQNIISTAGTAISAVVAVV